MALSSVHNSINHTGTGTTDHVVLQPGTSSMLLVWVGPAGSLDLEVAVHDYATFKPYRLPDGTLLGSLTSDFFLPGLPGRCAIRANVASGTAIQIRFQPQD